MESGETLILGRTSNSPLPQGHLQNIMSNTNVARSLKEINIHSPAQLAAHFVLDRNGLQTYTGVSAVMTDEFPVIEYRVPIFNDNYKFLLDEIFRYRPDSQQIANELGLPQSEAQEIDNAWKALKSGWTS